MSWRVKAIILFSLAAIPAGAWYLAAETGLAEHSDRRLASSGARISDEPLEFRPKAGSIYRYKFQRRIKIDGFNSAISPIEFSGELRLHITEVFDQGFAAIATEEVSGQAASSVAMRIRASKKGDELEVFSAGPESEIDQQHISVTKDLLSLLFFPLREDTTGKFEVAFERLSDEGDFIQVKKMKLAYRQPTSVKILASYHLMKWSRGLSMPDEVRGKEESALGSGEITSESSYRLKFSGSWEGRWPGNTASLDHKETLAIQATKISLKEHPEYAKLNWAEISSRLLSLDRLSSPEQLRLFGDLVRMLELDPAKIGELVALINEERNQGANSPLFQQGVGALATNGSPEAQAALVAIYQDPSVPISGKGSILSALTTTQAPLDVPTRSFLAEAMANETNKDLSQGAAFALGSSLEKAPDDNQSKDSIQRILSAWEVSNSMQDRLALLDVMGNSGRLEFYPAVSSALSSERESELRARGAFSLRFMASSQARELLVKALADGDVGVRGGAAFAIQVAAWNEIFRNPVSSCTLNESDSQIRKVCLEVHNRHSALAQQ